MRAVLSLALAAALLLAGCATTGGQLASRVRETAVEIGTPEGAVGHGMEIDVRGAAWAPKVILEVYADYPPGANASATARAMGALLEARGWDVSYPDAAPPLAALKGRDGNIAVSCVAGVPVPEAALERLTCTYQAPA